MNKTITFSDKLIAWFALLSGLSISAVAVWYSVAGLVAIFASSVVPIIVMGVVLEVGKLVATVWLKQNWSIAPRLIRLYLFVAVVILMMITSMGIFGYLSKAHLDQAVPTGNVVAQVAIFDEKIKTAKENIESGRKALKQMDATIDETIARSKGEQGAINANAMRTRQAKERTQIQSDIAKAQVEIAKLNEQRAPVAAELRKVEAEVGPIKYIAALLYDDNPDSNTLEKAVRWVIIMIVIIFDPLAVVLLLASQYSFAWFRRQEEGGVVLDKDGTIVGLQPAEVEKKKVEPTIVLPVVHDAEQQLEELPDPTTIIEHYPVTEAELDEFSKAKDIAKQTVLAASVDLPEPIIEEIITEVAEAKKEIPAPPGTPGEVWDTPISEQQSDNKLDKIYKASAEDLAKQKRSRGWFTAVFPKKDNN
jgi:DNA integrity scanning protein DisA with diadenylate cyclase activity